MNSKETNTISRAVFSKVFWVLIATGIVLSGVTCALLDGRSFCLILGVLIAEWVVGFILVGGIAIPRLLENEVAQKRAVKAKQEEKSKWGFSSRDREGPWLYYIENPLIKRSDIAKGKYFYSEWLIIEDGVITVNPGHSHVDVAYDTGERTVTYLESGARTYAYDGCSPKLSWWWCVVAGTPDLCKKELSVSWGSGEAENRKMVFWNNAIHAALVHDALYQYLHEIPINKYDVDRLFKTMLIEDRVPEWLATIYYWMVDKLGAKDVPKYKNNPNTTIERN